jgi:hypothetical protein
MFNDVFLPKPTFHENKAVGQPAVDQVGQPPPYEVQNVLQNAAEDFKQYIIKQNIGFAIDATVSLNEAYYGFPFKTAMCFLVTEEGFGNVKIYPFPDTAQAIRASKSAYSSNVVFDKSAKEVCAGGYGIAHETCRRNGARWLCERLKTA